MSSYVEPQLQIVLLVYPITQTDQIIYGVFISLCYPGLIVSRTSKRGVHHQIKFFLLLLHHSKFVQNQSEAEHLSLDLSCSNSQYKFEFSGGMYSNLFYISSILGLKFEMNSNPRINSHFSLNFYISGLVNILSEVELSNSNQLFTKFLYIKLKFKVQWTLENPFRIFFHGSPIRDTQ